MGAPCVNNALVGGNPYVVIRSGEECVVESLPLNVTSGGLIGLLILTLVSMVVGLWKALQSGNLATGRELREKNARIDAQASTIKTLEHQLSVVLTEAMTTISPVLRAMRKAADAEEADGP